MPNKTYRKVLVLGILCLIGILGYQAYLINNYNTLSEKEREDNVIASLYSVIDELYAINPDAGKIVNPVKKVSQGYFRVQVNDTLHPFLLEELLKQKFTSYNINTPFEYAIYDCFTDSTVYAARVDPEMDSKSKTKYLEKIKWQGDGHYFGVFFPDTPNARLNIPDLMMLSLVMLGFLLLFFGYTLLALTKEKRLHRVKQDFINNVTHQLKTPVSALSLGISALSKSHQSSTLELMDKEVKRLSKTINKVLLASKAEYHNDSDNIEDVDLVTLCKHWKKEKEGVSITIEHLEESVWCKSASEKIQLCLDILLENSLQHNPEKAIAVEIAINQTEKQAVLVYKDNGNGIAKSELKNVFQKFYSAKNVDLNHPKSGFGLGLYIAKESLSKLGGKIKAVEYSSGAQFNIELPR